MKRTPPKPPIVHSLDARRASRGNGEDVGPMFWAAVFVAAALAIGIVSCGGPA